MIRFLRWTGINTLFVIALYYAFVENVTGAQHLVQFYAWFAFCFSLLMLLPAVPKKLAESPEKLQPTAWRVIDVIYDTLCVMVFVWVGWQITAVAYLLHIVFMQGGQTKAREHIFDLMKEGEAA
jgi:hypothetical protein